MCYSCWEEYGKPQSDNPDVREASRLIAEVYKHSCVGSALHIVLDDWNVLDEEISFCVEECLDSCCDSPEEREACKACAKQLSSLAEGERIAALALHAGFYAVEG